MSSFYGRETDFNLVEIFNWVIKMVLLSVSANGTLFPQFGN